jgi:hypothetical protein
MEPPPMLTLSPDSALTRSSNPFEAARLSLIQRLLQIKPPKAFGAFPLATDFLAVRDHLVDAVKAFDEWIETIGFQVQENTTCEAFDMRSFSGAFSGAVDGNATFIIEECAENVREMRRAG